ncbi:RNA polymerase subunit AC19 [Glugoides intestinalis]
MESSINEIDVINEFSLKIHNEDHTIMNPLRWAISNNWIGDSVEFCGYTIPHPSDKVAHLNIQFEDKKQQSVKNMLKKIYEGLECVEVIATKLLNSVNKAE